MVKINKNPAATELCNEIRKLYFTKDAGWIARPHHTNKEIRIGHPLYGEDDAISAEIDALYMALDRLELAEKIGYTLVVVK